MENHKSEVSLMENNQKGITQLVFQRLKNDELMEQKYSNAKAILEYIRDNNNFRTLSSLIKETMILAKTCSEDAEDEDFIEILYKLLGSVNSDNLDNMSVKRRVKRWITGETESIEAFDEAIEVCYALDLNIDQTNSFLNKCGFSNLSSRNAKHAVHYYCIFNHKSLETAISLLCSFEKAECQKDSAYIPEVEASDNVTVTEMLWDGLNTDWGSDENFLNSFLIPNKSRFIGYSKKAQLNFYKTKNVFMTSILIEIAQNEKERIQNSNNIMREICEEEYPLQYKLRAGARKVITKTNNEYYSAFKDIVLEKIKYTKIPVNGKLITYQMIADETFEFFSLMKKNAIEINDYGFQYELSKFLNGINRKKGVWSLEKTFKDILFSIIGGKDGRIRPILKESNTKYAPVLNCFPTPKSIKKYENFPALENSVLSARKIIILMYFVIFCYETILKYYLSLEDYQRTAKLFCDNSFKSFIDETNKALKQCSLSVLYPPNQYDCLILMIARKAEKWSIDDDDPLAIFNEVLELMFNK